MGEGPRPPAKEALLLVDGGVIARHILVEYLQHCGYSVIGAASTEEALAVLQASEFTVSAVLRALPAVGSRSGIALA